MGLRLFRVHASLNLAFIAIKMKAVFAVALLVLVCGAAAGGIRGRQLKASDLQHMHSLPSTPASFFPHPEEAAAHQRAHAANKRRLTDFTNQDALPEDCDGGTVIQGVFYLPSLNEVIVTPCPASMDPCGDPAYVLDGTPYWSLGGGGDNQDKVIECQDDEASDGGIPA